MSDRVKVILDTDISGDCDDAASLAMLHAMADGGEVELLAVMVSCLDECAAPCVDAINRYFGRPEIPIGVRPEQSDSRSRYAGPICREYPNNLDAYDAVDLYRRILASQPDSSVVIIEIGHATNISRLLVSRADGHSPLSGKELIAQKVKLYAAGGNGSGELPEGHPGFNYKADLVSAVHVLQQFPNTVPLVFAGGGGPRVMTGEKLKTEVPADNITRRCFELYWEGKDWEDARRWRRTSPDQLRVLFGVRGLGENFVSSGSGIARVDLYGNFSWEPSADGMHSYLTLARDPELVAEEIEELMKHQNCQTSH